MGLDYTVSAGYGFFLPGETAEDLAERLGQSDYEIYGLPERELLQKLGYSGLSIIERLDSGEAGGWAIIAEESHRSIDPKTDAGIWALGPEEISDAALASLTVVRDELFPLVEGETITRPSIGWFLMASIW